MPTERIVILFKTQGGREADRQINVIGKSGEQASRGVGLLKAALAGLVGAATLRGLTALSDEFITISNRLRLVTQSERELIAVRRQLLGISRETRSEFLANAELFNRLALNTRELGVSQQDLLDVLKSVNEAVKISGATPLEARTALIQLSQGLASGTLRGDELRSVMEQIPVVADVIADRFSAVRGELRVLGSQGRITANDVIRAFQAASEDLEERFGRTVPTIGERLVILRNEFVNLTGDASGFFDGLGRALGFLTDNLDVAIRLLGVAGFTGAVLLATKAVIGLTVAIATNPLGLLLTALSTLITLLTAAVGALVFFSDRIQIGTEGVATLYDLVLATIEGFRDWVKVLREEFGPQIAVISSVLTALFGEVDLSLAGILIGINRFWDQVLTNSLRAIAVVEFIIDRPELAVKALLASITIEVIRTIEFIVDFLRAALKTAIDATGNVLSELNSALQNFGQSGIEALKGNLVQSRQLAAQGAKDIQDAVNAFSGQSLVSGFIQEFNTQSKSQLFPQVTRVAEQTRAQFVAGLNAAFRSAPNLGIFEFGIKRLLQRADEIAEERRQRISDEPAINLDELAGGGGGGGRTGLPIAVRETLANIGEEIELLRLAAREREVGNELRRIEQQLLRQGIQLEEEYLTRLRSALEQRQIVAEVAEALDDVRRSTLNLVGAQVELDRQIRRGQVTVQDAERAMRALELQQLESSRTVEDGFRRGFINILDDVEDFASLSEEAITNAFEGAEDALLDFVATGKAGFTDLVRSILLDLTKLAIRQSITAPLAGALGSAFGIGSTADGAAVNQASANLSASGTAAFNGVFSSFGGGFADGGRVRGGVPILVGERGPEMFVPDLPGQVVANGATTNNNQRSVTVEVNQFITTPNADSFRRSKSQITADMQTAARRAAGSVAG